MRDIIKVEGIVDKPMLLVDVRVQDTFGDNETMTHDLLASIRRMISDSRDLISQFPKDSTIVIKVRNIEAKAR